MSVHHVWIKFLLSVAVLESERDCNEDEDVEDGIAAVLMLSLIAALFFASIAHCTIDMMNR
jgi:uncharacterized membrane protein